ncbi:hypothetical protein BGX38DRAFT_1186524 [Terfezia claveryi]|nr:hypothetical protein BGX38DRAFT_1186524 [Terfezia claveryi]
MKLPKDNEEDLTQSRWFIRTWPLRSTPASQVTPETFRRESRLLTPPEQETPVLGQVNLGEGELATITDGTTATGPGSTDPLENSSNVSPPDGQPLAPTGDASIDNAEQLNGPASALNTQQGWIGWLWYGNPQPPATTSAPETDALKEPEVPVTDLTLPLEDVIVDDTTGTGPPVEQTNSKPTAPSVTISEAEPELTPQVAPSLARSSWFGFWGGYRAAGPTIVTVDKTGSAQGEIQENEDTLVAASEVAPTVEEQSFVTANPPDTILKLEEITATNDVQATTKVPAATNDVQAATKAPAAGSSGWSFWYRSGVPSNPVSGAGPTNDAAVGVSAQAQPQEVTDNTPPLAGSTKGQANQSQKPGVPTAIPAVVPKEDKATKDKNGTAAPVQMKVPPPIPTPSQAPPAASAAVDKLQRICPPNHVFPDFDSCYNLVETPPLYCKFTRLFKKPAQTPNAHLFRAHGPRRVKKAVAIGVHGFFPMRLVRTVLGEPTGTSVRFAQSAAAAIKRWAEQNGIEIEVETVALEGEGKVADRVEMLWKLLEKWMDHVKNADFVLIGAHSQGVVVGLQLLARMIEQGWVDNARVGVAAMAGINLGPFYHLPTSILTGSAKELFEFQRPESAVSKKYIQALRVVLAHDVRIVFIGSIDDQLVPLESSTFTNIHHPYIYRAVFVDGRVHAPNFLSHLVGFAMKLRNLGISDHGLIRQLSTPLAGSLYGGEGHSRIYDDDRVYDLTIRHALETTDSPGVPLRVDSFELPTTNNNPFFLPWAMRGLLEEHLVRTKLEQEKNNLLQQFDDWKPTSKVLKDVKFRLEGINQTRPKL